MSVLNHLGGFALGTFLLPVVQPPQGYCVVLLFLVMGVIVVWAVISAAAMARAQEQAWCCS